MCRLNRRSWLRNLRRNKQKKMPKMVSPYWMRTRRSRGSATQVIVSHRPTNQAKATKAAAHSKTTAREMMMRRRMEGTMMVRERERRVKAAKVVRDSSDTL